jgi:hypothetical protein
VGFLKRTAALVGLLFLSGSVAFAQEAKTDTRPGIAPDIRGDETNLKVQRGDFSDIQSDPGHGSGRRRGLLLSARRGTEETATGIAHGGGRHVYQQ